MSITFYLLAGALCLYLGAEACVKGSSRLAAILRISSLTIGLTIVAFGTSLPEASVSISASLAGRGTISLGNIVGSNIANIGLILGICALISPVKIHARVISHDAPLMTIFSFILIPFLLDGRLGRIEGAALLGLFLIYMIYSLMNRREFADESLDNLERGRPASRNIIFNISLTVIGLFLLIVGGRFFVDGAVMLSERLGISGWVISLTVIAVGTSLPELATSVVAAFRKKDDIAIGNIVGSNIFNVLLILGLSALVNPIVINEGTLGYQLVVLMIFSILILPFARSGFVLKRLEGGILLLMYVLYIVSFGVIR